MADIEEQMEMFGYTAEGAKQEAKKLASGVNTDLTFKEAATTVGSMLPGIGTAMTVGEIEEELKKENPSYGKIALLGGSEVIGLIPGLGTVAKSALKAAAKKIGANKIIDALDAPKPKTESEIMIGPAGRDYYNENLDKAIELEKQGVSPGKIEAQTGRVKSGGEIMDDYVDFPTFDPVFKFEIDDTRSKLYGKYKTSDGDAFTPPTFAKTRDATEKNPAYLGQVLDHPILFEQYPDLKQVKFAFDDLEPGELGVFSRQKNMVILASKYKKTGINDPKLRNVLFHEIQHAAQFQDFKKQGYQMLSGGPDYFAKVVGEPKRYMGSSNVEAQLNANALLNDDKIIAARDDVLNFYNKYKDTGDLSYIMTFPDGMKKTLSPTDQLAPIDAFGVQMLAGQKLSMKFKNRKVATEYAQKMSNLQNELFRKYIEIGAEIEARVVGKRAQKYGYNPDAMKVPISSEVAKQRQIKTKQEYSKDRPDNFFTKKLKFFKEKIGVKEKFPETEIHRHLNDGILFGRYASGQDADLGFAEGGDTVRPEPRPETRPFPDVRPQERPKQGQEKRPDPILALDPIFPKSKLKPEPELRTKFITKGYEVDGREIQVGIIKFKGGEEIALDKVLQNIDTKGTADETPVLTERTILQVLDFIKEKNPTREEFETYWYNKRLNKGGAMMDKQMQMAFMDEGGLTDDGMDVDPVSGNDIPSGSMAEEVRDDIPAQLSDGEYVVPADVVRYYGVKFFEDLRERAKMGLQEMEMNGRIGGEPVPAGGPINTEELSPEEMQAIQEMMGMSQGGSVDAYKAQQELLEQPPAKAVGNPVMMANGGDVESTILGGKTSSQVGQDFLDQGKAAMDQNYTGIPLGSTIFDPVNTNTGVQQTEVKPFTPITLYNTSGQTRTVNSEAEERSARDAGFTMTQDQYNMYRSQRGGQGGSGGGSGIITPPGQGGKEKKPWGADVDWSDPNAIREFVKNTQEGNIEGASGRFLRGAGFAIFGLPGAMLAGAFQVKQGLDTFKNMESARIIAEAMGVAGSEEHKKLADEIQGDIRDYLKRAGGGVNFFSKVNRFSEEDVNELFKSQGFEDKEDFITRQTDYISSYKKGKAAEKAVGFDKKKLQEAQKSKKSTASKALQNLQKNKDSYIKSSTDSVQTAKNVADLEKSLSASSQNPSGTVSLNRGGLMQKKKKAKK